MLLNMLKAKIHRATVTETDLHYEGSIGIDAEILEAAGILPFEHVDVWNVNSGQRFQTYAIVKPAGSREISINGAAARMAEPGDKVIIAAFVQVDARDAATWDPAVVLMGEGNEIQQPE